MAETGYINPRLGFQDTGYSELRSYCYWHKRTGHVHYVLNIVCRPIHIHETYLCVMDDHGTLVVVP